MLKTLRWALAFASNQTEPLLATLLLPDRPKPAFTSLLSHPSVLHVTTSQNTTFLDPTSWTGQADLTRTLRSGTDIILVGNQKGYDTYYTTETCSAQLETALLLWEFQTTESDPGLDQTGSNSSSYKNT